MNIKEKCLQNRNKAIARNKTMCIGEHQYRFRGTKHDCGRNKAIVKEQIRSKHGTKP
jgi:hypothetical protein